MSDINLLDLDALEPPVQLTVKLGGKNHDLAPVTVDTFGANAKLLAALGKSGDVDEDLETMKKILLQAFPTMTRGDLGKLRMDQLRALTDAAMEANGQKAAEKEAVAQAAEKGEENPQ